MKVAIVDYGMGNLGSVRRALAELGVDATIAGHPEQLAAADRLSRPGVGSFSDGMAQLAQGGWCEEIRRQTLEFDKPLLGICLGMQLLASRGNEGGLSQGLDLIPGEISRLDTLGCTLRIPHVGWNAISRTGDDDLFSGIPDGTDFYFVHSYAFRPASTEHIVAHTDYGIQVIAAVGSGNILGTQFHPEKSSKAGFRVLRNFLERKPC
jgi:glutamine amidotransferase